MRKKILLSALLASSAFVSAESFAAVPDVSSDVNANFSNEIRKILQSIPTSGINSQNTTLSKFFSSTVDTDGSKIVKLRFNDEEKELKFHANVPEGDLQDAISNAWDDLENSFFATAAFVDFTKSINSIPKSLNISDSDWEKISYAAAEKIVSQDMIASGLFSEEEVKQYFNSDSAQDNLTDEQKKVIEASMEKANGIVQNDVLSAKAKAGDELSEKYVVELIKKQIEANNKLQASNKVKKEVVESNQKGLADVLDYHRKDVAKAKSVKDLNKAFRPDNYTTQAVMASTDTATTVVDNRLSGLSNVGVAAGDDFDKYGVWIKGSMSRGNQKSFAFEPGYKSSQNGITIGADIGDDYVIGLAYSLFNSDVKSAKANDTKEKASTHIATLYGSMDFDDFYVNGHVKAGKSNIKKDRYSGDLDNHVAKGKTTGKTYGGKVEVGYNYAVSDAVLTPSLAVSHNDVKVKGYKEKGQGLNRKIGNRNSSRTDGIVGLTAKYKMDTGSMLVVPEIHAFASQALSSKNSATKIYLVDGIDPIVAPAQKLTKSHYKIGTALNVYAQDSVEASVGYDYGMAKKFKSHTGTVKLRVNF